MEDMEETRTRESQELELPKRRGEYKNLKSRGVSDSLPMVARSWVPSITIPCGGAVGSWFSNAKLLHHHLSRVFHNLDS